MSVGSAIHLFSLVSSLDTGSGRITVNAAGNYAGPAVAVGNGEHWGEKEIRVANDLC